MPSERNSFDKPREYRFHRELIQDPERLRDRIAASRDDEESFAKEQAYRQNYSTSNKAAALTLIASAANIVSKRPLGRFGLELANSLTMAMNRGKQVASKTYRNYAAGAAKFLDGDTIDSQDLSGLANIAEDVPLLGHLQIFKDLDNALDTLGQLNLSKDTYSAVGRSQLNPELRNYISEFRRKMLDWHRGYSTHADGVEELTVDKIIQMSTDNVQKDKIINLFGEQQIKDLRQAHSVGLIDGKQRIDRRIFLDRYNDEILDTRILSGSYLAEGAESVLSKFQIPLANITLQDIFGAPVRHLFGRGEFSGVVRDPYSKSPNVRRVVIGEELYRVDKKSGAFRKIVTEDEGVKTPVRMRVSKKSKLGEAVLAKRGQLASQRIRTIDDIRKEDDTSEVKNPFLRNLLEFVSAVSEDVGVGRRFATQESVLKTATIDLARRRIEGTKFYDRTTRLNDLTEEIIEVGGVSKETGKRIGIVERAFQRLEKVSREDDRDFTYAQNVGREIKAAFGIEDEGIRYLKVDPSSGKTSSVVSPVRGVSESDIGTRAVTEYEDITVVGRTSAVKGVVPLESFAYEDDLINRSLDVVNFMTTRLNDLIGATVGIGFKPGEGPFGFVKNAARIYGMAAATAVGYEALKYTDYLTGIPTGGYKASNLLLDLYGAARISAQFLREFTALSPAARYMEDLMPGSIESSASEFVRTISPFAIALKMAPTKGNLLLATMASALIGELPFPGLSDKPQETIDKLYGEEMVPMRSGRYWMLGKQPFGGGRIQYFAPSMFARMQGEYKYTETLYGSQAEYFRNISFLPTPSNFFKVPQLVGNVLSPIQNLPFVGSVVEHMPLIKELFEPSGAEYLAQKHRHSRPYPTAFAIEQVSNRFIGDIANPGTSTSRLRAYETPGEVSKLMGRSAYPGVSNAQPAVKQGLAGKSIQQLTELSGIYKFGLWDVPFKSGSPASAEMADPAYMNSMARAFYDESVGGLMGHTELLRRFVMSDYHRAQRQATNTISNTMPTWLPGSRSIFMGRGGGGTYPGDRTFHIDFSTGDPFAKIPHGEFRLPSAARERAFRLHSGTPGVYDAVDRFLVLADVAPNSEAYRHYKTLVEAQLSSGIVDDYWTGKILKTQEHVKQKLERYQTISRKFNGVKPQWGKLLDQGEAEKSEKGIRTFYTMPEQAVGTAWEIFTHDMVARAGITVPILGPMLANKLLPARDELEAYIKREVYDTDEYDWTKPYTTMLRPMHEQLKATDPFTASIGGFISGTMIGANPIAKLVLSTSGAMYFGARSSMRAIETGKIEKGYVPNYVTERRKISEYFDNLEYMKYRRLEKEAKGRGLLQIANHFTDLKKRTISSLDYSLDAKEFVRDAVRALPSREKQLFVRSLDAPIERKKEILEYIPEYLKPVYQAAWAKQGDNEFSYSNIRKSPDARTAEYFATRGMPDKDWVGFSPDVPMNAVKVKTMDSVWGSPSQDIHRMGIFSTVADQYRAEFPDPDLSVYNFYRSSGYDAAAKQQLEAELMRAGLTDFQIEEDLSYGLENIVNFDMTKVNSMSSFFSEAINVLRN